MDSKKRHLRHILNTVCFGLIIFGLMIGTLLAAPREFSGSERRRLAAMPILKLETILNGEYFSNSEQYLLDQMLYRDLFRGIKAFTVYNLLRQKDNNDLYIVDGWINKIEYPLKPSSVQNAAHKFNEIHRRYFPQQAAWLAVIPDKNYFLADQNGYLSLDYQEMIKLLKSNLESVTMLDIFDQLTIEDYYYTDIHWRQENLLPLADYLLTQMGHQVKASDYTYERKELYPFRGSYYGQAALKLKPDSLIYLSNDTIQKARVYDHEKQEWTGVYSPELFSGIDPYDVFMGGARAFIQISNEYAESDRELIIFRDSFGSSLAPLLLPGYARITLIDLRYMHTDLIQEYIELNQNQDILFLYSVQVLNNSAMLR